MAISVYGWRKPTLELELVEGGSLLPNTKYIVAGYLKYTPLVYNSVGSPLSDIQEITTTSTHKSIKITQKTYRDITNFANSGGVTLITSTLHCLATGDEIKIASGSYAGTHTITKISKDTFTIPVPYVDNVPVQCYTDSTRYNHPLPNISSYDNLGHCMTYFVSTYDPRISVANWYRSNWTSAPYQYNNNTNPTTITAQPTGAYTGQGNLQARDFYQGPFKSVEEYGTIYVRVDSSVSLQNIYDAIIAEGFPLNCVYSYNQNHFLIVGTILFYIGGAINVLGASMTFVLGEIGYYTSQSGASAFANCQFNSCLMNFVPRITQPSIYIAGNNNVFGCNLSSNGISGVQNGSNNTYWATPLTNDPTSQTYLNLATGLNISAVNITSKKYLNMGISSYIQASYGLQVWADMYIPPIYYTLVNSAINYEPAIYMMSRCQIYKTQSNNWHYRFYQYPAQDGLYNKVKFLNIDTDEADNVKKCINNRQTNIEASWWRRFEFNFIDENKAPISGVSVSVSDSIGNVYTGTSDVNGYCYVDVKEQQTVMTQAMGILSTWSSERDTYYSNFSISISKDGFERTDLFVEKAWDLDLQEIKLKTAKPIRIATDGAVLALSPEEGSSSLLKKL